MMKKIYLFKMAFLSIALSGLLFITGCSSSDNTSASSANVLIQLTTDGTTPYLVDQMTVSIQKSGGSGINRCNQCARYCHHHRDRSR